MSVAGRSMPSPYDLLTRRHEFSHSNGRVTLCGGDFLYSPNCVLDVSPPPPKPSDNLTDNIFHANGRFLDPQIFQPKWWTTAFGYLSFVPRNPAFSDCPFNVLGSMIIDSFREGHKLRESVADHWVRLEANLDAAVHILGQRYNITFVKPFAPAAWGYRDYVRRFHEARKRAALSRDWMVIWMGMLSYSIAIANTQFTVIPPDSAFAVPDWFNTLTDAGINQIWASDVALSSVANFSDTTRVGLYVDVVETEKNQPSVGWFCTHNVPVWYRWNAREIHAMSTSLWLANLAPPTHLLQQAATIMTRQPSPPPPREPENPWKAFLAERERRNEHIIKYESTRDKQRRLDRLQHPPVASAKVFRWVDNGHKLVRESVPRKFREDVYLEFGEHQRKYDPVSNEWDLCEEFGPPDDTRYRDDEDSDDDEYMPGPIEPDMNPQPPPQQRSPSPPQIAEDDVVEEQPEIHEVLGILMDYYGFVQPSHLPSQAVTITRDQRKEVLHTLGVANEDDEIFNTRLGKVVVDFVSCLSSRTYPDLSCWDLSRANPQALARRSDRLKCVGKLDDNLFVFDFGKQATLSWRIAVTTFADVLTVCRMDPNERDITIARSLFSRGIRFRTLVSLRRVPKPILTELSLPYRLSGYQFTQRDYEAYLHQRARILAGPRGRAALLRGGFVWRLAMQTMGFDDILKGPLSDVIVHRIGFSVDNLWDDDLTETELDLICGAYICFTGSGDQISIKSWWPLVSLYERMDCGGNFGRWTSWREEDYQRRLVEIQNCTAEPMPWRRWRDKLKGQKTARDMKAATANFSEIFLRNIRDGGL